eukprot:gene18955-22650_t
MKVQGLMSYSLLESTSLEIDNISQAIAELADNTRDAAAKRDVRLSFWIDFRSLPGSPEFEIHCWDNGPGVPKERLQRMLGFGFSDKSAREKETIGQYGLGVKHACMRLAHSALIFIKTEEDAHVILMSPGFLLSKEIEEIEYPTIRFTLEDGKFKIDDSDPDYLQTAENLIAYSNLKSLEDMTKSIEEMPATGVKYILFQVRNNAKEFNLTDDSRDVIIMHSDGSRPFTQARAGQANTAM